MTKIKKGFCVKCGKYFEFKGYPEHTKFNLCKVHYKEKKINLINLSFEQITELIDYFNAELVESNYLNDFKQYHTKKLRYSIIDLLNELRKIKGKF